MTRELKKCTNCHGENLTWQFGNRVITGQQHNRLSLSDIEAYFFLGCDDCSETLKMVTGDSVAEQMNTRAAPDVPELVRYICEHDYDDGTSFWSADGNHKAPEGDYVLHSQAAEIIAAKDAEIDRLSQSSNQADQSLVDKYRDPQSGLFNFPTDVAKIVRRLEAAEAELATLKEINANLMGDDEDKPRYTTRRLKHEIEKAAEAKLAQYEAQEPVAYRYRHSEQEKWHYGETDQYWWEHQPLYASPAPCPDLKAKCDRYEQALVDIAAFKEKDGTDAETTQWNRAGVYAATIARAALNVEASNDKG